jgi:hypothetical protein
MEKFETVKDYVLLNEESCEEVGFNDVACCD